MVQMVTPWQPPQLGGYPIIKLLPGLRALPYHGILRGNAALLITTLLFCLRYQGKEPLTCSLSNRSLSLSGITQILRTCRSLVYESIVFAGVE